MHLILKVLVKTLLLACVAAQCGFALAGDGDRKLLDAQRQVVAEDALWPAITSLADGSLGLTYQHWRYDDPNSPGPNVSMEWMRSTDGGLTWSDPVIISERLGAGGLYYDRRDDGGYIVYERRNQAIGQLPSGRLVCAMADLNYYYNSQGVAEQQNYLGSTFRYDGMVYTWSDDLGQTWSPAQTLPSGPFGGEHAYEPYYAASPQWRIVTMDDGTALMSLYGSYDPAYSGPLNIPAGTTYMSGVIRSTDNGETWGDISTIMTKSDGLPYEETALCALSDGKLLAHVRTQAGSVVQYASSDGGRTWAGPTFFTQAGQHPGGAFELESGLVMATWGNRRDPYGAMAMLSYNGGDTWDYAHRVSLAWDASGEGCGYANGAQAGDGSIVVVYYDSIDGGKVYSVRFTEEQFLAAAGGGIIDPPGGIAVNATFAPGSLPTDFGMTAGGNVNPTANVAAGKWTNNMEAGQMSNWMSNSLPSEIIGPKIHGLAEVGQATLNGAADDQTLCAIGTDSAGGSFSFIITMNNGAVGVMGGSGINTYAAPVNNQDSAFHSYGWEFDAATNRLKLFFDKVQVGDAAGYDVGGNFFCEELMYFGDGSGGLAHSEVWDRWLVAEGEFTYFVPGDANADGIVDSQDAARVSANWLMQSADWADGDFNADGQVDDADAAILAANWLHTAANTTVPEPSALLLMAGCVLFFVLMRFREPYNVSRRLSGAKSLH